ncbi:MAG: VanZ family protein [Desulfotomaculales bacterium]
MLYWLLAVTSLAVIAYFSRLPAADQDLRPFIRQHPVLVRAAESLPHVSFSWGGRPVDNRRDPVRFLQFCVRKAAHLFLYGMYGLSLMRALGGSGLKGLLGFGLVALLVVMVAALDEHNQARIAGRSGRPEDVGVDFAGFLLFCGAAWGHAVGRRRRRLVPHRGAAPKPGLADKLEVDRRPE